MNFRRLSPSTENTEHSSTVKGESISSSTGGLFYGFRGLALSSTIKLTVRTVVSHSVVAIKLPLKSIPLGAWLTNRPCQARTIKRTIPRTRNEGGEGSLITHANTKHP